MHLTALISPLPNRKWKISKAKKLLLIMKLTAILLTAFSLGAYATGHAQGVTIDMKDAPVQKVFKEVIKQTGVSILYDVALFEKTKPVSIHVKNGTVEEVVSKCLQDLPYTYTFEGSSIIIKKKPVAEVQSEVIQLALIDIHGRVVNEDGEPVEGAAVRVKGTNVGTTTNSNGEFSLKGINENAVLVFSGVNIETTEIKLNGKSELMVIAKRKVSTLENVVVNKGYYSVRQIENTGDVSVVDAKTISMQPVDNVLAAMEGRVPGMFITQTTGAPGGGFTVQIRGQSSILNGNDPFYVIDGVPYPSQTVGILNPTLRNGNPLNYLNPADIESIEILKDADATAIYGSRAANGAILITTKKGKAGKMKVDVNIYSGIGHVTREESFLNTSQYLQMRHEAFRNDSLANPSAHITPTISNAPDLLLWDTTRYTDWQKVLLGNTAHYNDAQASISGGTENVQYLFGGGYHSETSVFPLLLSGQGKDQKASAHFNILATSSGKKFKVNINGSYLSDHNTVQPTDFQYTSLLLPPDAPSIFNKDGSLNWAPTAPGLKGTWTNPFAQLYQAYNQTTSNLVGNALLSYALLPGLNLKASLGYTNTQTNETWTMPTTINDPGKNITTGSSEFNSSNTHSWIVEPQADYRIGLGKGILTAMGGLTFQENTTSLQELYGSGFINDALLANPQSAATLSTISSTGADYKYNAVFGRVNYNWSDKYILNLTARRDGSSRFGPGNQFANFGAAGAEWVISNEDFIKTSLPILSFAKLRGSYGTSGNDQIGDYRFMDLYSTTRYPYQGIPGVYPANLFNPNLAWELDKKLEGGIELGFLKDRIFISASYFRNRSNNELVSEPLSLVTGFSAIPENLPAVVENFGWEFVVNTTNIRNNSFSWTTSFNLTIPRNKLVSFPNLQNTGYANTYIVGDPLTIKRIYHLIGVNDTTGVYQFATSKGGSTYVPTPLVDNTSIVNTAPRLYGGFENNFQFRGFVLDFLFQFVKQTGINIFGSYTSQPPGTMNNMPTLVLDHWMQPGDMKSFEQFTQVTSGKVYIGNIYSRSSDFIYSDASFIRLKNVSISYTIPAKWKQSWHIENLRIFIQGQNLFTITKYSGNDPESQGIYMPPIRVLTGGFHITL